MGSIWVICIDYDYGVWPDAGYFKSKEVAERRITSEHARQTEEYKAYEDVFGVRDKFGAYRCRDDDGNYLLTKWYAAELEPNTSDLAPGADVIQAISEAAPAATRLLDQEGQ